MRHQLLQAAKTERFGAGSSYWPLKLEIERRNRQSSRNIPAGHEHPPALATRLVSQQEPEQQKSELKPSTARGAAQRLAEVTHLHDAGLLTDDEYVTKCSEIIKLL